MKKFLISLIFLSKLSITTNFYDLPDDIILLLCHELSDKNISDTLRLLRSSNYLYNKSDAILSSIINSISPYDFPIFPELSIKQRLVIIQEYMKFYYTDFEQIIKEVKENTSPDLEEEVNNFINRFSVIDVKGFIGCSCGDLIISKDMRVYSCHNKKLSAIEGELKGKKVIQAIKNGHDHYWALTSEGMLYAWGENYNNEPGLNNIKKVIDPIKINFGDNKIANVTLSTNYGLIAITTNGKLYHIKSSLPKLVEGIFQDKEIISIKGFDYRFGLSYNFALSKNGQVYKWENSKIDEAYPIEGILENQKVILISSGYEHMLYLTTDGKVYAFGDNLYGQLGLLENMLNVNYPSLVNSLKDKRIIYICAHKNTSKAITFDGETYVWGKNNRYQLGLSHNEDVITPTLK